MHFMTRIIVLRVTQIWLPLLILFAWVSTALRRKHVNRAGMAILARKKLERENKQEEKEKQAKL
jgi:hypothetical protein